MKLKRTYLVSHLTALVGFVMALVVVALLLVTALCLQEAIATVQVSTAQRSTYQRLLSAFTQEEAIQNAYTLSPGPQVRREQLAIATSISQGIQSLQQDADPADTML